MAKILLFIALVSFLSIIVGYSYLVNRVVKGESSIPFKINRGKLDGLYINKSAKVGIFPPRFNFKLSFFYGKALFGRVRHSEDVGSIFRKARSGDYDYRILANIVILFLLFAYSALLGVAVYIKDDSSVAFWLIVVCLLVFPVGFLQRAK